LSIGSLDSNFGTARLNAKALPHSPNFAYGLSSSVSFCGRAPGYKGRYAVFGLRVPRFGAIPPHDPGLQPRLTRHPSDDWRAVRPTHTESAATSVVQWRGLPL